MISDLEGEKRRHAHDLAQSDDVGAVLQSERDKLLQQVRVFVKNQCRMESTAGVDRYTNRKKKEMR